MSKDSSTFNAAETYFSVKVAGALASDRDIVVSIILMNL